MSACDDADKRINVPSQAGFTINKGQTLAIHAAQSIWFCCTIGDNFSPSIKKIQLQQGCNGPYTANTTGTGTFNTSTGSDCNPSGSKILKRKPGWYTHKAKAGLSASSAKIADSGRDDKFCLGTPSLILH